LKAASKKAKDVLLNQRLFLADETTFNTFQTQLDTPVAENKALHYLLNQNSPWKNYEQ